MSPGLPLPEEDDVMFTLRIRPFTSLPLLLLRRLRTAAAGGGRATDASLDSGAVNRLLCTREAEDCPCKRLLLLVKLVLPLGPFSYPAGCRWVPPGATGQAKSSRQ